MEKRKVKRAVVFYPCTMGVFILLIIILSFTAGTIRRELVLTLTGAVVLAIWAYCLVMTLLLALIHRRRAKNISIRLEPEKIVCGGSTNAVYTENNSSYAGKNIFQFPGILVRLRIILKTKDGRRVTYDFKPENKNNTRQNFQVKKRGAYFSDFDEFAVFDIMGFFRFAYRIPTVDTTANSGAAGSVARLLVSPDAGAEPLPVRAKGGETNRQETSPVLERTDYLIDHRPYVPGDDPRRINWKLYSHGGELIVRQGEREPPPSSSMTILIDTQYDSLYASSNEAANSAADAVDLLCENALAIINNAGKEINVQIGYTSSSGAANNGAVSGNSLTQAELGFFLSYPAALPMEAETSPLAAPQTTPTAAPTAKLPAVTEDRGIIILALPRINTGNIAANSGALEKFLADNANRSIELIFICAAAENALREKLTEAAQQAAAQQTAAQTCAGFYNRHYNVKAQAVEVR